MIAQPGPFPPIPAPAGIEQEVLLLRAALNDALSRIGNLEQRLSQLGPEPNVVASRLLVARDSAEMAYALQLCQEVFPGCTADVQIEHDPDAPQWPWYTITIQWQGEVRDSVDREMCWHEKLATKYPSVLDQFRLFIDLK